MPVTLQPTLEALGHREPAQQRAVVKLLQAAGAFGAVEGVNGVLTDPQADAILQHITFNDNAHALAMLHQITQEHLLRPEGKERSDCQDSEIFQTHRRELTSALLDMGMLADIKPQHKHYDHVLLMGATEGEVNTRLEYLKQLWEQGVRFDKIVMLGSERPLNPQIEPSAGKTGPSGHPVQTEMDMMEARYYDPKSRFPEGMDKVRIFEVNTFNKEGGKRANTQDTVNSWLKTKPDAGEVLVVSSQPYVQYQQAAVQSVMPPEFRTEAVGAAAADDVKISVALDSFARQIDVNRTRLTEKLKSGAALSTPLIGVDPQTIKVDAATYQFRAGGDANGVTEKGRYHADHWDPILHGDPILLHERLDGTMYVADGHHRVELAKELNAKGVGPGNIMAMVLSEKQGYSAKDAKIIAAYKNIAHGQTDVVETAKVFKEAYAGDVKTELLPHLQMDKGNLKMAFTMSKLSDKVLDQVAAEKIDPKIAEKLAETLPNDHDRQEKVMQIISKKMHQDYTAVPNESHASSVQVNMQPLVQKAQASAVASGFVAKLATQRAQAQASASIV